MEWTRSSSKRGEVAENSDETESYLVGGRSKKKQMIHTYFQKIKSAVWLRRKAQGRVCSQDDSLTRLRETGSQSLL